MLFVKFKRKISDTTTLLFIFAISLLCISMSMSTANATSIRSMSLNETAVDAEFIFEGQVLESETRWNAIHTDIATFITFSVKEVLKGEYDKQTIVLRFSGGEIGEDKVVYQGIVYPAVGESGIYFVESVSQSLINPLVGWSRGHFKLRADANSTTVMNNRDKPIMSVAPSALSQRNNTGVISDGSAAGLKLGSPEQIGMSKTDFKRALQLMLEASEP